MHTNKQYSIDELVLLRDSLARLSDKVDGLFCEIAEAKKVTFDGRLLKDVAEELKLRSQWVDQLAQ